MRDAGRFKEVGEHPLFFACKEVGKLEVAKEFVMKERQNCPGHSMSMLG